MEQFRKKLKADIYFGAAYCAVLALIVVAMWAFVPASPQALSKSFVFGFLVAIAAVMLAVMARNAAVLRSEAELKKCYIRETDERLRAVETAAGKRSVRFILIGLSFAMVVTANFSRVVSLTLLDALIFTVAVNLIAWAYYRRKM